MSTSPSRGRILIVDDEVVVADSLKLIFSSQHYDVRAAYSAEAAIEVLSEWRPDLAMLDVMLPKMNGIELAGIIQSNYPSCRVLLISGHPGTAELLNEAKSHGLAYDILAKPLHPTFILDTVSGLMPAKKNPFDA
ncbi:MAG TPA: response regulator [Terracidiphilus sp.]|nr:response regulator [Terracidiphilus sp.]